MNEIRRPSHLYVVFTSCLLAAAVSARYASAQESSMPEGTATLKLTAVEEKLSQRWRDEGKQYVAAVNAYVAKGEKEGWNKIKDKHPEDTRGPLAKAVLDVVRRANTAGTIAGLRESFPPGYEPFSAMLDERCQSLNALLLDDGRIVLQIGTLHDEFRFVLIHDSDVKELPDDILAVGRSPRREIYAIARRDGITLHRGWDGPITAKLKWPIGTEGAPAGYKMEPLDGPLLITQLIPFDSGVRALAVSSDGIFILGTTEAKRLLPTEAELRKRFDFVKKEFPQDPLTCYLDMQHGALSPSGKWIAAGHQDSVHYVFDAETLKVAGEIGNRMDYPHYAVFSNDEKTIAFNSCHFYNGITIGAPIASLPGLKTERYKPAPGIVDLQDGARVYAAVSRTDEFIVGDAHGYLRAFDAQGRARWQHFIGSTVESIDVSSDGKRLIVTTYAGFLVLLDLDTGRQDPHAIGTSTHLETRRWLFWKNEKQPLAW